MRGRIVLSLLALSACGAMEPDPVVEALPEPVPGTEVAETPYEMFEDVLAQHQALNERVERVAYRLQVANVGSCAATTRNPGFTVHTLKDYPEELQMLAGQMLGVSDGMSVRSVVPGSPAEVAGLRAGDALRGVGAFPLVESEIADRVWLRAEATELQDEVVAIKVLRNGKEISLDVPTVAACDYPMHVLFSELPNAHTDGETIYITSELVRRTASDSRLALVLAHELAHALIHTDFEAGPEAEFEADAHGLEMMRAAGFDMTAAIDEMESFAKTLTDEGTGSHPEHDARVARLRELAARLD